MIIMSNIYSLQSFSNPKILDYINKLPAGTIIEFLNTKGIDSNLIKYVNPNIKIRIIGGLDEKEKPKFDKPHYFDRTIYTPKEVYKIIEVMEKIESKINPSWNDLEKSMYIYKTLCENMKYEEGSTARNLDGLLTRKSVCVGFALIYKEMLDRQGIVCHYQHARYKDKGKESGHAWNLVQINGKLVPVDLTWDNTLSEDRGSKCDFTWFGRNKSFYNKKSHQVTNEELLKTSFLSDYEVNRVIEKLFGNKIDMPFDKTISKSNIEINSLIVGESSFYRCFLIIDDVLKTGLVDDKVAVANILNCFKKENFERFRNVDVVAVDAVHPENAERLRKAAANFRKYQRDDGTVFFLDTDGRQHDGLVWHNYTTIEKTANGYLAHRTIIKSEDNLLQYTGEKEQVMTNLLLSENRVKTKTDKFDGYIGYVGIENGSYRKHSNVLMEEKMSRNNK